MYINILLVAFRLTTTNNNKINKYCSMSVRNKLFALNRKFVIYLMYNYLHLLPF